MTKLATALFFLTSSLTLAFGSNINESVEVSEKSFEVQKTADVVVADEVVEVNEMSDVVVAEADEVVEVNESIDVAVNENSIDPCLPEIFCEEQSLIDEEIEIMVVGLKPNQVVTLEASWTTGDQVQWISFAQFRADNNGIVNVADQAPLQGSYEGVDSMGLFWSMKMGNVVTPDFWDILCDEFCCRCAFPMTLRVFDENGDIAKKIICRITLNPDVEVIQLRENGLIGDLFIPNTEENVPVVLVLGGSEGGIPDGIAQLMSSNGIAAFALAHSGIGDLPPYVENVELEYFERAFQWLQNHPRLNGKISIWGVSRGAELALLLGSMFPDFIDRIVAVAPSSVVLSPNAWLYKGESVLPPAPFVVDFHNDFENDFGVRETPHIQRTHFERGIFLERERFEQASIPVEKIKCPIMLISGGDDQLGPSSFYAKQIFARLAKFHSKIERIHLDYPKAGHFISFPYIPRVNLFFDTGRWINVGGTPLADELASRDAWEHTIEFLCNY
ncbi:MAG: acyl-CoA thioesterase/BAAT N-terminal domain-containing protein [Verrucomicrobia bacterium]|nr:acyl-CoA thioesterase/BAAT N-terminal domain-containing protein [Verrucomicrobiota bacterium]